MSYSFRNRPKLSDRYRGKSGDEILNELKNQIDEDRKVFFESSPGWSSVQSPGSFSRAGHPLDDMMSRGRQDIRSHLDDLAQRHPEFADHLRCPPWGGEMGASSRGGTWGRKRRGSGSSGDDVASQESPSQMPEPSEEVSPSRGRSRQNNLPQYGLRNTVDLGQQQQQQCEDQEKGRGQRSWSAPPDNRTQNPPDPPRFVSRLDIPVNPMPSNPGPDQGKPPVAPKQQPQQQPQQSHNVPPQSQQQPNSASKQSQQQGSNVRHIPIFVEGRDEPLLPKAAAGTADAATEKIFTERVPPQPTTFNYGRPSYFTARQNQQQPPPHVPQPSPQMPQQTTFTQQATPPKAKTFAQQQQVPPQHQPPPPSQHQKQESAQQQEQAPSKCTLPQPQKQPAANDPIFHVQAIQKDVDELKLKVDNYSGNSRKDKDYMYLDEMLTRNLLKLDNIETEGKDDVRQARKAVIRNIQQCISILESKVPSPDEVCQSAEDIGKSSEPSGEQNSDLHPETELNKMDPCTESSLTQEYQDVSGTNMDVENLPHTEATENKGQLGMETDANIVKESGENAKSDSDSQEGQSSKLGEKDLSQEKSENFANKAGESSSQQINKEENEKPVKSERTHEQMEVDSARSKEAQPISIGEEGSDEKATGFSPKMDGSSNKTKTKSPKGSPKKGKRTT